MRLVIRVDDVGWTQEAAEERPLKKVDVGLKLAQRFHAALGGLPWLAGVIPSALDDDGYKWLLSGPAGLTVAMHGVTHRKSQGVDSEFRGMTTKQCESLLTEGVERLGLPTSHFIPPFNALEPELTKALKVTGFKTVWGQYEHGMSPPRPMDGLTFVPSYFPLYSATLAPMGADQPPILSQFERGGLLRGPGFAVVTLHLPWEAAKCDADDFEGVRELARVAGKLVVSPDDYLREAR